MLTLQLIDILPSTLCKQKSIRRFPPIPVCSEPKSFWIAGISNEPPQYGACRNAQASSSLSWEAGNGQVIHPTPSSVRISHSQSVKWLITRKFRKNFYRTAGRDKIYDPNQPWLNTESINVPDCSGVPYPALCTWVRPGLYITTLTFHGMSSRIIFRRWDPS